jgi:hypothetical protein
MAIELVCYGQFRDSLGGKLHLAAKLVQKKKTIPIIVLLGVPALLKGAELRHC